MLLRLNKLNKFRVLYNYKVVKNYIKHIFTQIYTDKENEIKNFIIQQIH